MLDKFKYPIKSGEKFYRARVVDENSIYKKSYSISEMGAPPLEKAIGGRANPDGISYLYLASNINTAIAEVRPWKKANVNIVSFEVLEDLLVFFPMLYVWKYKEGELNHFFWFSYLLNEEFSKPINPSKKIDYFPTQYISEFIKNKGLDGIYYKSALGDENNLTVFNKSKVKIGNQVELYEVENITYESIPKEIPESPMLIGLSEAINERIKDKINKG